MSSHDRVTSFERPEAICVSTIEAHTAGEPLRVITGGIPEPPGRTMLDKRSFARREYDGLRRLLMWEPRGHADMYGCLLTEPVTPDGDTGVLFLHNDGFSTMCGHGIIGLVKVGLEAHLFEPADANAIQIDTPAGRVVAQAHWQGKRVASVSFLNVASFLLQGELQLNSVSGVANVNCDIAFGGAFYAYVDAASVGLEVSPGQYARMIELGRRIKHEVDRQFEIRHPAGEADLNFLYGTIFVEPAAHPVHSRNVCVFADGEVDRSPTGTGVSGRAAILHARGQLGVGNPILIESLVGSRFQVEVVKETRVGGLPAVIPRVTGSAHVTGKSEFILESDDPFPGGFLLR